jgi:hypothetical protein
VGGARFGSHTEACLSILLRCSLLKSSEVFNEEGEGRRREEGKGGGRGSFRKS